MKPKIKVQTISKAHVAQLTVEHYWAWESRFDFNTVNVLGRMARYGHVLCQNKGKDRSLRLISAVAYVDWYMAQVGGAVSNAERKAKAAYKALPQLFQD